MAYNATTKMQSLSQLFELVQKPEDKCLFSLSRIYILLLRMHGQPSVCILLRKRLLNQPNKSSKPTEMH